MSIINKITVENIKKNKRRTIVTIIGVMLSSALICAVAGMLTSFVLSYKTIIEKTSGNYYACYYNVPQSEIKYLKSNDQVTDIFYSKTIGYSNTLKTENEYKPYEYVIALDDIALENTGLSLAEGSLPKNENEIVLEKSFLVNSKNQYNIGDTITLDIGKRYLDDKELYQIYSLNNYNAETTHLSAESEDIISKRENADNIYEEQIDENGKIINQETIKDTFQKTYKIVGFIERVDNIFEPYSAPGYTCITRICKNDLSSGNLNVYVKIKNAKKFTDFDKNILDTIKKDTDANTYSIINNDLLQANGALTDERLLILYTLVAILIIIIIVSSVFLIRNSFVISVTEKTRQYGILSSIGATSKQLKKSILLEGFIIGTIGTLLGIFLGIFAGEILIKVVNYLLKGTMQERGASLQYSISPLAIITSIACSVITIYFSSIIPAKKASKISPIDAIRETNDVKINNKKIRTSKLTKKLFGVGGVIASKNLKRSKKKYRTTVVSLIVSITIFISLSTFVNYGFKMMNLEYKNLDYNLCVTNKKNGDEDDVYKEILKSEYAKDYAYYRTGHGILNFSNYASKENNEQGQGDIIISICFTSEDYFKKYADKLNISYDDINNLAILYDESQSIKEENGKMKSYFYRSTNIKEGETIDAKINVFSDDEQSSSSDAKIKINKIVSQKELPRGFEDFSGICNIFVSENNPLKNQVKITNGVGLFIKTSDSYALEKEIKSNYKIANKINVTNVEKNAEDAKNMIIVISIFLYGFIIVITLIGITNIFNIITTNMLLRAKEFAVLRSIGMTNREFNKMIRLESIMYCTKSLIIGIPLGLAISYLIYYVLSSEFDFGFIVPYKAIIICIVFIFLIIQIIMNYSIRKINKQNIVDTIRNENI